MKSAALLVTGPNRIEVAEVEIPAPGPGQILIRTAFSCISPGTERRAMGGHQAGFGGFPFIPGYTMSGTVLESAPGSRFKLGDRVFCLGTTHADRPLLWGGHTAHAVRDEGSVFLLPEDVSLQDASIAKMAAIARRGVRVGEAREGETVAVIGLGPIGQLSARLHAAAGARVVGADLSQARVDALRATGIEAGCPSGSLVDFFRERCPGGVSLVVDATGSPEVLRESLAVAFEKPWDDPSPGPRVVVQGSYPAEFSLAYEACFRREVQLRFPRDNTSSDLTQVLELLAAGTLSVGDLVASSHRPDDCQAVYDALLAGSDALLTAVFNWSPEI